MASYTCPTCDITLKKGSWELFTHCPECQTPWIVDPRAPARNLRKVKTHAILYFVLSFVPIAGVVFGILGVFWGYLAIKFRYTVLGVTFMLLSAIVGLVFQSAFAWWGIGQLTDRQCLDQLQTLSASIRTYNDRHHRYPQSLPALTDEKLPAPTSCIFGGVYFYLPPSHWKIMKIWRWKITTISANSPAPAPAEAPASAPAATRSADGALPLPGVCMTLLPPVYYKSFKAASMPALVLEIPSAADKPSDLANSLMVTEIENKHRYTRNCLMADFSVREMPDAEFQRLLKLPQNRFFARTLEGAAKAGLGKKK
jgi:hypothetical protein